MGMSLDMDPELREMIAERAAEKIAARVKPTPEKSMTPWWIRKPPPRSSIARPSTSTSFT